MLLSKAHFVVLLQHLRTKRVFCFNFYWFALCDVNQRLKVACVIWTFWCLVSERGRKWEEGTFCFCFANFTQLFRKVIGCQRQLSFGWSRNERPMVASDIISCLFLSLQTNKIPTQKVDVLIRYCYSHFFFYFPNLRQMHHFAVESTLTVCVIQTRLELELEIWVDLIFCQPCYLYFTIL